MRKQFLLAIGALVITGCPAGFTGLCDNGACDTDASVDGGGDSGPQCDPQKQNCIDPTLGVFVAPTGNDSNDGTEAHPLQTIGAGLSKAKAGGKSRVYVCAGTYAENVVIKDAISLLGGFSCSDWTYASSNTATVSPASGYPLHVTSTTTSINDISFVATDATNAGDSSVAAIIVSSSLSVLRTSFTAGKGASAGNGATGSNYTPVAPNDPSIEGKNASGALGGGSHACTLCVDGKNSTGGYGGNGGTSPGSGQDGQPNLDGGVPIDGKGGTPDPDGGGTCANGHKGSGGAVGSDAPQTTMLGVLDSNGWHPSVGLNGGNGGVAQGGGGGGGVYDQGNGVGGAAGGGCGGCGGAGGAGGGGGGASLAMAVFNSVVTATASAFHAGIGGNGGNGAAGQAGEGGGIGGGATGGCGGGTGGAGGNGGAGAGGAGGISVGLLWKGTKPTIDGATTSAITVAAFGTKGTGGNSGNNDGIDGVAQAVLQAP